MDLAEAVDELYAAPLADFVAVRTALVTCAKDEAPELVAELKPLRKPTAVAWLLNQVTRQEPAVVTDLLDLGERMRAAQAKGDAASLSAARPERDAAIEALVGAARRCAEETGASFGASAADGVSSTAVAVLADPASGAALSSGRLLRPLAYAGFGEVQLDDAVALLRLVPPPEDSADHESDTNWGPDERDPGHTDAAARAARERRERELTEARDAVRESERALGAAKLAHSEAVSALEAAAAEVERRTDEVRDASATLARLETRPTGERA